jgi:ATP-binding cassette, subfamily F, member 2
MPPSASKQKRLAEKAAKAAARNGQTQTGTMTGSSTPTASLSGVDTPLTSVSAAGSTEDLSSMAKLQIATDRYETFLKCLIY